MIEQKILKFEVLLNLNIIKLIVKRMTEIMTWIIIAVLIVVIIPFLDCIPIPFLQSLTKPLMQLRSFILKIFWSSVNLKIGNINIAGALIVVLIVLYALGIIH